MRLGRWWGRGNSKLQVNRYRFSVWDDEKILETDSGDLLHNTANVLNTTVLYT